MSFSVSLPLSGLAGWELFKRTEARQALAFAKQGTIMRDEDYFRAKIGSIRTAEALVDDRRLLRISLEAFGLQGDLNSKAFIKKVLESSTLSDDSLASKLVNPKYRQLASAFGFGDFSVPRTALSDFADGFLPRWKQQRFEAAVGETNNDFRLAMNARRELAQLATSKSSETTKWLRVLGNGPLWQVMRQSMNLPASYGRLDLDSQLSGLKARATALFGEEGVSQFADPAKMEKVIQRFLITASVSANSFGSMPGASPALALLQQSRLLGRL